MMNENQLTLVKEYEFDKLDIHELDKLLDDIIKDCRNEYIHTFEYRLVYEIQFTKNSNDEQVNFTITHRSLVFETEFYGLNKKIKSARRNGFIFNQLHKLTIKIDINLPNINIDYYLEYRIPMMHRHFSRISSRNLECVQTHCNVRKNPFACHDGYL